MTDTPPPPMTRERMRQDVAALLRVPPGEIGDHDDLGDLGLDSMRTMDLLMRWADAGFELDLMELSDEPTLAGWWAVASRKMDRSASG